MLHAACFFPEFLIDSQGKSMKWHGFAMLLPLHMYMLLLPLMLRYLPFGSWNTKYLEEPYSVIRDHWILRNRPPT